MYDLSKSPKIEAYTFLIFFFTAKLFFNLRCRPWGPLSCRCL